MRRWSFTLLAAVLAFAVVALPGAPSQTGHTWSGVWSSTFGDLTMTQAGTTVTGTYTHDQGHISGTVSGNVLTGRWDEAPTRQPPSDAGVFALTMSADGKNFTGHWGYGDTLDPDRGWIGHCYDGLCAQQAGQGLGPLHLRLLPVGTGPQYPLLSWPTTIQYPVHSWVSLVAWFVPPAKDFGRLPLPKGSKLVFQRLEDGEWRDGNNLVGRLSGYELHGVANPSFVNMNGCGTKRTAASPPMQFDWTWRAVLKKNSDILAVSAETARTICQLGKVPAARWNLTGTWTMLQQGGYPALWSLRQTATRLTGTSTLSDAAAAAQRLTGNIGSLAGSLVGNKLDVIIQWPPRTDGVVLRGRYVGTVTRAAGTGRGKVSDGRAWDLANPNRVVSWTATGSATCTGKC